MAHRDSEDDAVGFTGTMQLDDIPPSYEPGRFHMLTLGAFVVSHKWRVTLMNGRRIHGGTAPLAPEGVTAVANWATRAHIILYSPEHMLTRANDVTPFAILPNGTLLKAAPELIGMWYVSFMLSFIVRFCSLIFQCRNTSWNNKIRPPRFGDANWAQDGEILMDDEDLFNFFIRFLLQFCSYLLLQLSIYVVIDTEVFLSAFTLKSKDGSSTRGASWAYAPDLCRLDILCDDIEKMTELRDQLKSDGDDSNMVLRLDIMIEWEAARLLKESFDPHMSKNTSIPTTADSQPSKFKQARSILS